MLLAITIELMLTIITSALLVLENKFFRINKILRVLKIIICCGT
ncbi:hypothetical protein BBG19_0866 [Francisella sp. MA067296]|nr:hypothetical protein BBG19_0866 [Francisella sp. MA067296]